MSAPEVRRLVLLGAMILSISIHGFAIAGDRALPYFPREGTTKQNQPFRDVLKAYYSKNYKVALEMTLLLRKEQPRGPISETALFLVGDLHLKLAEKGDPKHLRKALGAFRSARSSYPDSENAVRGLWRIGQIYALLDLYYESIANFNRLIIKNPKSPFVPWAQLGIAETYQRWGKINKALESYDEINIEGLPNKEVGEIVSRQADLYYRLGSFKKAFQTYGKIPSKTRVKQMSPETLFQYSESAYKAQDYSRSRKLFMAYFSLYPDAVLAPIALARVGETWRLQGKTTLSRSISKQIHSLKSKPSDTNIIKILAAISDLRFIRDDKGNRTKKGRILLEEIRKQSEDLLENPYLPEPFYRVILEAAELSAKHGALENALSIEEALLDRLSPTFLKKEVRSAFKVTSGIMTSQLTKEKDAMKVIEVYHRHPNIFKSKRSTDPALLKVAISHKRIGLFSEAVRLLTPLTEKKNKILGERALFHLTDTYYQNGDDRQAEESARQFLNRYSGSRRLPDILETLAKAIDRQGKVDQAIQEFRSWLKRYPKHRNQKHVSLFLADAYQRKGKLKSAVNIYAKIYSSFGKLNKDKRRHSNLHMKLADAYFRLGNYKKSASFYKLLLKNKLKGSESDWAKFQLAMSYDRLGKETESTHLFTQLAEKAEDPLLKEFSVQRTRNNR
ncbi:MAG: tetratricopeptide repeat protein [Nitrospiria bacterium]